MANNLWRQAQAQAQAQSLSGQDTYRVLTKKWPLK